MAEQSEKLVWGCCALGLLDDKYVKCSKCKYAYHFTCLASNEDEEQSTASAEWMCPLCNVTPKNQNKDNTPVRYNPNITIRASKRPALNSPPSAEKPLTREEMLNIAHDMMSQMEKTMKSLLNSEVRPLKEELKEVKESMSFMNAQYEEVLREQEKSKETIKNLQTENNQMQVKIEDLSSRVNQLEQNARMNNVEIQCLPEKRDENLLSTVTKLANVIDCQLTEENVVKCTRIARMNKDSVRPRSIVVQFSTPRIRDQFLAASIKFNKPKPPQDKLNSSHLGMTCTKTPIFITEHLSATNKALHAAARLKAKQKGFKYVWIRGGRIYMRKTDNSEYIIVKDINSLDKIK
ncbi:hypothetical protein ABMA28_006752 [Loxostege sticticalis]|uniref:Zinc finger PHD-type domain-containing protein n=1 Tax=Loxostege sticticalis TaxID=481309 RepID=A0ABD0TN89_LOXSC